MPAWTLLYDGDCKFCRTSRDLVVALVGSHRLDTFSIHDEGIFSRFPQVDPARAEESMQVISPEGEVFEDEAALQQLLGLTGWYLRWLAHLFWFPGVPRMVRWLYDWVAIRRHQMPGLS